MDSYGLLKQPSSIFMTASFQIRCRRVCIFLSFIKYMLYYLLEAQSSICSWRRLKQMFDRSSCYILLVEDNVLDADLIRHAVQKAEASVNFDVARDGEEALFFLKRWEQGTPTPIVILLDLKLPKVSGLEVLAILKTHPRYKVLPVVVLTSSNLPEDIQKAYELGANSYILKSIDYDQFANAVNLIHRYWCGLNVHPE
jgi:CheY-like chemotaxis protein